MFITENLCYVSFFLFVTFVLKYLWLNRTFYLLSWQLPGPFALPLIGNGLSFLNSKDMFATLTETISKYPSPMRVWLGPKFVIIFTDPTQVEKIMFSSVLSRKDKLYKFIEDFDGKGLITASGPKWRKDRKLLVPLFKTKAIRRFFPKILEHTKILITHLETKSRHPKFDVGPYLHRCVGEFIVETIMGQKVSMQNGEQDNFLKTCNRMFSIVHARMSNVFLQFNWIFKLSKYGKEHDDGKFVIRNFLRKAQINAKETYKYKKEENYAIIDNMLHVQDNVPEFVANDTEFLDHLVTLYSASEDTITIISSFALVLLGLHPEIQDKVYDELVSVLPSSGQFEIDDLDKFEYMHMCLKDVLRLFPIAPFTIRSPAQDYRLDDWVIPKNCSVTIGIHNMHRNPKYWKKPNEFYPEHFLPDAASKRHKYAYLPFSAGPRSCVGKIYAMMALKIMLTQIIQRYVIEADGKLEDFKLRSDISVRFKDDIYPIRIKPRNSSYFKLQ